MGNIKKQRKDSGLAYSYVSKSGERKVKEAKKIGPPCKCPWKCFEVVDQEGREILFRTFYDLERCHHIQISILHLLIPTLGVVL